MNPRKNTHICKSLSILYCTCMLVYKKPLNTVTNDKSVFNKLQKFVFGSVFGFGIIQICLPLYVIKHISTLGA